MSQHGDWYMGCIYIYVHQVRQCLYDTSRYFKMKPIEYCSGFKKKNIPAPPTPRFGNWVCFFSPGWAPGSEAGVEEKGKEEWESTFRAISLYLVNFCHICLSIY